MFLTVRSTYNPHVMCSVGCAVDPIRNIPPEPFHLHILNNAIRLLLQICLLLTAPALFEFGVLVHSGFGFPYHWPQMPYLALQSKRQGLRDFSGQLVRKLFQVSTSNSRRFFQNHI